VKYDRTLFGAPEYAEKQTEMLPIPGDMRGGDMVSRAIPIEECEGNKCSLKGCNKQVLIGSSFPGSVIKTPITSEHLDLGMFQARESLSNRLKSFTPDCLEYDGVTDDDAMIRCTCAKAGVKTWEGEDVQCPYYKAHNSISAWWNQAVINRYQGICQVEVCNLNQAESEKFESCMRPIGESPW